MSQYSRIEILSDGKLTSDDVILLHDWFREIKPLDKYTIWAYRQSTRETAIRGRYN